jgi:hypothetical protein
MAMLLIAIPMLAQVRTPRVSPQGSITQTVGTTDITVKYSRPGVKGRTIWGDLVPYDQVWRTGANEATTVTFSEDVTVEGQKLAKGTYSLHTIPGRDEWTVIFNSVADQWGSYSYDAAKDVVRVKVKPQTAEFREWMGFEINDMTTDTAKLVLRWANVAVPVSIDTGSTARTMAALRAAMQPGWMTSYQAASFAFENKGAATDAEINAWVDQSIKIQPTIANYWLKARIAERAGNKADAIRFGEMAIAAATPQQTDFANEVRRNVEKWKGATK